MLSYDMLEGTVLAGRMPTAPVTCTNTDSSPDPRPAVRDGRVLRGIPCHVGGPCLASGILPYQIT